MLPSEAMLCGRAGAWQAAEMPRTPLFNRDLATEHPQMANFIATLRQGRYLQSMPPAALQTVLRQGELIELQAQEALIRQHDASAPEMYLLIEGSLAVITDGRFILRLDRPGDVAGELSVISSTPRSASVIAETPCRLIAFAQQVFAVDEGAQQVPAFYYLFAHVMAEKLRQTTTQSLLRRDPRVADKRPARVALILLQASRRSRLKQWLREIWPQATSLEFSAKRFLAQGADQHFELLVTDLGAMAPQRPATAELHRLLRTLAAHPAPCIVMGGFCNQTDNRQLLIDYGIDEFLREPVAQPDLRRAVQGFRRQLDQFRQLDEIEQQADVDALTGLATRRRMQHFIETLSAGAADTGAPFALLISDIDHFKRFNDSRGHLVGDQALAEVAQTILAHLRQGDLAVRYGGDEFVMILPGCDTEAALLVADKLRREVAAGAAARLNADAPEGLTTALTITLGIAVYPRDGIEFEHLMEIADRRLYRGKDGGRNRVISGKN